MTLPDTPRELKMLINGHSVAASDGAWSERKSPAHDVPVTRTPLATEDDVNRAVDAAKTAFDHGPWPRATAAERSAVLMETGRLFREASEELALLETLETGKPILQSRMEADWTAALWEYSAALARHLYGDSSNNLGPDMVAMTLRDPIGVVGLITPWNFPMLIISQKLPFALAAGCTTVVKPAGVTPSTTIRIGEILKQAGLPDGVCNVITGSGGRIGSVLCGHEDVEMISFTGSTEVGRSIVRASADTMKKVELELGGKNPLLVFADADLERAVDAARLGAYFNMGECCNSSSRILVEASIADTFVDRFVAYARELPIGDPLDDQVKIGPIITEGQYRSILDYIAAGKASGAKLRLGGDPLKTEHGLYIPPTVFDHVPADASIAREEIFGPVLSILRFKTAEEAIALANGTTYGLSAGVFTTSYETAISVARGLRAGTVWVNNWLAGYNELSFGGYKQSGLGRELGRAAVEEYTEPKTVQMHYGKRRPWW